MKLSAVAFDLDGTLYPDRAFQRIATRLFMRNARLIVAYIRARRELHRLSAAESSQSGTPGDGPEFRLRQAELVSRYLRIPADRAIPEIERIVYGEVIELFARIRPYPGAVEAIDRFRRIGLPVGLLSDLPPLRKLELMGIRHLFDVAHCSEDSGLLKPAGRSFHRLAFAMGVEPGELLYVGNNPRFDLEGARGAGMRAAIVSSRNVRGADLSFSDWGDLVGFVEKTLANATA